MLEKFLLTLLQALITAAVPVITTYLCKFFSAKRDEAVARTKNDTARLLISQAFDAVTKAVAATNQTYVDALKESDMFTPENQQEAFHRALTTAKNLLSEEALAYLNLVHGSATEWLSSQIEAQVRTQKMLYAEPLFAELSNNEN